MVQLSTPWVTPNWGMGPPWGAFCQITLTSCYYSYYYVRQNGNGNKWTYPLDILNRTYAYKLFAKIPCWYSTAFVIGWVTSWWQWGWGRRVMCSFDWSYACWVISWWQWGEDGEWWSDACWVTSWWQWGWGQRETIWCLLARVDLEKRLLNEFLIL